MKAILLAGLISLVVALIGTRLLIGYLQRHHFGQQVRDDGPQTHLVKQGTPTMGGLAIAAAVLLAYGITHLVLLRPMTASGLLVLGLLVTTGFIGWLDDWSKIKQQRSLGIRPRTKLIGQALIGIGFGILATRFPDSIGMTPASTAISFTRDISWLRLPLIVAIIWMTFLITGFSNAVNLTDGLDGLAVGSVAVVFGAYALINIWQSNQWCERSSIAAQPDLMGKCYHVRDPYDLALVSITIAAACFGFLWWNARPARIYVGDTGALGLGGAVAGMAILTRTELLLVILGLLFVVEAASVAMQVLYFKATKGKRIFKMAPLHHHFELLGWAEETVVVRFWIMCGIAVCIGFGLFYAEWVVLSR